MRLRSKAKAVLWILLNRGVVYGCRFIGGLTLKEDSPKTLIAENYFEGPYGKN